MATRWSTSIRTIAHAFTEGLEFRAGFLYESTGLEGFSTLSKIKLETGQVVQQIKLDPRDFRRGNHDHQ